MTVTEAPPDRLEAVEAKLDLLTEQMAVLTADAELRRRQRESMEELAGDLAHISEDVMVVASRELESLSQTADLADTLRLLRRFVEVAPTLERALVALEAVTSFVDDAAPMGGDVMAMVTERLAEAEQRGYFDFARASARVADRVVSNFDESDIDQLGDNVVTILETVREITQPEMLALLGRMVDAVQAERVAIEQESAEPPSLWALARQVRDPDVRRGMGRALHTLRAVSAETGPSSIRPATAAPTDSSPTPTPNTPLEGDET